MVHYTGEPASIVLDPSIRNWVLIPIMAIMVLVGILKHYVSSYFALPLPKTQDYDDLKQRNAVLRSVNLRQFHTHIHPASVADRKAFSIVQFKTRAYLKPARPQTDPDVPDTSKMMDGMMGAMKQNMVSIVPQTLIMAFINSYFSGFLLIKLPFPLTIRFKSMLQSGIMTPDLETCWVSSLSWYFINLFGLGPIFRLILGQNNAASESIAAMHPLTAGNPTQTDPLLTTVPMPEFPAQNQAPQMMLPGLGAPASGSGYEKTFDDEVEFLQLMEPGVWIGDDIEERVIALLKHRFPV